MNAGLGNAGVRASKTPQAPAATVTAANNGLSLAATTVQLGGLAAPGAALLHNSFIDAAGFGLTITGTVQNPVFKVIGTTGVAIAATVTSGAAITGIGSAAGSTGVYGEGSSQGGSFFSTVGIGANIASTAATGLIASSSSAASNAWGVLAQKNLAATNTVIGILNVQRNTTGVAANGIGSAVEFFIQTAPAGLTQLANQIVAKWTTAANATRVSQLIITGVDNAVTADLLTISGSGATRLNKYGIGTFAGVPAFTLQVDANGNLIEGAAAGGGWGTTGTVATLTGNAELLQAGFYFAIKNGADYLFTVDPGGAATFKAGDTSFADAEAEIQLSAAPGTDGAISIYMQNNTGLKTVQVNIQSSSENFEVSCANGLKVTGNAAALIHTGTSLTNGAGALLGTLATSPIAGDPTKWLPIDDNGTIRHVPAW